MYRAFSILSAPGLQGRPGTPPGHEAPPLGCPGRAGIRGTRARGGAPTVRNSRSRAGPWPLLGVEFAAARPEPTPNRNFTARRPYHKAPAAVPMVLWALHRLLLAQPTPWQLLAGREGAQMLARVPHCPSGHTHSERGSAVAESLAHADATCEALRFFSASSLFFFARSRCSAVSTDPVAATCE